MIPLSRIVLEEDDVSEVVRALRSGMLAQGDVTAALEKEMAAFVGVRHAAAVSSGTAALHLALLALGVGRGSEVIIPTFVCTALLNAVHYTDAAPVIVDIDPATGNMDPDCAKRAVTPRTRAVIVPHMFGLAADMDALLSLGVPVIEDCAQSVGAALGDRNAGTMGAASVFSLYATKMLCAGEGGMVLSDDPDLIARVRDLRDYDEKEAYAVRYNYKMTDIHAALGRSRLRRLPAAIRKRREIAARYHAELPPAVHVPVAPEEMRHVYYRYVIEVDDPSRFMKRMHAEGVVCRRPVFRPLHRYLDLPGYGAADRVWSRAVSIPVHPSLTEEEVRKVVRSVRAAL